jgi:protein TonB
LIDAGDNRSVRVIIAAVLGSVAWVIFLVAMGRGLQTTSVSEPKPEPPLEMSVVDMADPASTQPAATTGSPSTVAGMREASPPKQPLVKPARTQPPPARTPMAVQPSAPVAHAPAPSPATDAATDSHAQTATADAHPSSPDSRDASATPTAAESAPGNSPARAISQPLPAVPDDLREQAYRTVAIVHLVIHTDGSVAVELVKPTPYPRLNQILVETLRGWRFFPALQNGHPAETQQDVRVHFNVS